MKKAYLKSVIALIILIIISSCAAYHNGSITNSAALSSGNFSYVKMNAKGVSMATYYFGIGGMNIETLVNEAKQELLNQFPLKDNQALTNITVNFTNTFYLGIVMNRCCIVTADIVEFKQSETVSPKNYFTVNMPEVNENNGGKNISNSQQYTLAENKTNLTSEQKSDIFVDSRDNKIYKTVKIGNQIWMAENLAYNTNSGCWAYGNNNSNISNFGYLYNWEAAKAACPPGWRIPSDADWLTLVNTLGGDRLASAKMKSQIGWDDFKERSGNGNNSSRFFALPAGFFDYNESSFTGLGKYAYFWTSTAIDDNFVFVRLLSNDDAVIQRYSRGKSLGFSVRCIKN